MILSTIQPGMTGRPLEVPLPVVAKNPFRDPPSPTCHAKDEIGQDVRTVQEIRKEAGERDTPTRIQAPRAEEVVRRDLRQLAPVQFQREPCRFVLAPPPR